MNFTEDEKEGYENHLKWLRIQTNTIKKYQQDARAEGKAEGLAKGKREIAKNLLKQDIAIETVMEGTGLTREEVVKIKKNLTFL